MKLSWRQATDAEMSSKSWSHTVPHTPLWYTSSLPRLSLPPTSRTAAHHSQFTTAITCVTRQFYENCNARHAYRFITYLMEYTFTFTFASREFPPTCLWCIVCDCINRPWSLTFWHLNIFTGYRIVDRVMGFHRSNLGLPIWPFRSQVKSRHATDGRTDRTGCHFTMPLPM